MCDFIIHLIVRLLYELGQGNYGKCCSCFVFQQQKSAVVKVSAGVAKCARK